ncbi:SWEET family sugar transporter [Nonomuraea sp. NBC_00507]|uniref:SemiSWEET family sugar transporter n=1 Tax=Nonomuraea sp. NBC_00507 TaxID=2976002 RepID=UPI002E1999A7
MTQALAVAATVWGMLGPLSLLAQRQAIIRAGSSRGVSLVYLMTTSIGYMIWLLYGAHIQDFALIIVDGIGLITGGVTLYCALRLRISEAPATGNANGARGGRHSRELDNDRGCTCRSAGSAADGGERLSPNGTRAG